MWWMVALAAWAGPADPGERGIDVIQTPAFHDRRQLALVVGNDAYQHATQLRQAREDAQLVGQTLRELGFEVTSIQDADHRALSKAIADFGQALEGAGVGIFYYAGHAVQVDGINYLVPVDAEMADPAYVDSDAVDARRVLQALERANAPISVVILDACRNNPWLSQWSSGSRSVGARGLADMRTRGLLIAYATNPGNMAQDSGVYAQALRRHLTSPCRNLNEVFALVHDEVAGITSGRQEPWIGGSYGIAFNEYQPAGCDGEPSVVQPVPAVRVPASEPAADPELEALQRKLDALKAKYQQRCVDDLRVSTDRERRACHEKWQPQIDAAQDALDQAELDRAG